MPFKDFYLISNRRSRISQLLCLNVRSAGRLEKKGTSMKEESRKEKRNVHGRLNASWKICSLAVNGQSFLVIFGYLLNSSRIHILILKEVVSKPMVFSNFRLMI
jgi:hypothetical protein